MSVRVYHRIGRRSGVSTGIGGAMVYGVVMLFWYMLLAALFVLWVPFSPPAIRLYRQAYRELRLRYLAHKRAKLEAQRAQYVGQ